jgi:exonuclease III
LFGHVLYITMNLSVILIWNVQDLNQKTRYNYVHDVIISSKTDNVCLQEIKLASVSQRILLSALGSEYDKFIALPAIGSHGVFLAWKEACCHAISSRVDSFSVFVQFPENEGRNWWFTSVYGPQEDDQKVQFLHELRDIRALCAGPWFVAGDFNLIIRPKRRITPT